MSTQTAQRWPVYGHEWAVSHLRKSIAHGRIRHAYFISGPQSTGKHTLTRAFALTLNCTGEAPERRPCLTCRSCKLILSGNHPDILYSQLDPATGALKIEEVRDITARLALKPFEARYRIAIFDDFDHAQPRAQDALLKSLEEPPPYALLILLAQSTESILPTIISRSQHLPLRPLPTPQVRDLLIERYSAAAEQAERLAQLSGGRPGWAIQALENPDALQRRGEALDLLERIVTLNRGGRFDLAALLSKDKLALLDVLELWQTYWRDVLLLVEDSRVPVQNVDRLGALEGLAGSVAPREALHAVQATAGLIRDLKWALNTRLALEVLLLDYPGLEPPAQTTSSSYSSS